MFMVKVDKWSYQIRELAYSEKMNGVIRLVSLLRQKLHLHHQIRKFVETKITSYE